MGKNAVEIFEDWINNSISPEGKKLLLKHIANNYTEKILMEGYYTGPNAELMKGLFTGPSGMPRVCPACKRPL